MLETTPTEKQVNNAAALFALSGWALTVESRDGSRFYRVAMPRGGSHEVSSWHAVTALLARLPQGVAV